jgi:hypothetical protein
MAGATDIDELVAAVSRAETQRDENWAHVLRLQAELREARGGNLDAAADAMRWQQRATDLAAILSHHTGASWDHPVFDVVERRAERASAEGQVLDSSVLDELDSYGVQLVPDHSIEPPAPAPTRPAPDHVSRAERRRLEREARRRRP